MQKSSCILNSSWATKYADVIEKHCGGIGSGNWIGFLEKGGEEFPLEHLMIQTGALNWKGPRDYYKQITHLLEGKANWSSDAALESFFDKLDRRAERLDDLLSNNKEVRGASMNRLVARRWLKRPCTN